jgi:hypothetical protein
MSRGKAEWIEAAEASRIMSARHGRPISTDYVRLLGRMGHIRYKRKDKRSKLYNREDVEQYHVQERHASRKPAQEQQGDGTAPQGNSPPPDTHPREEVES